MSLSVCLYISTFLPGGAERQMVNLAGELGRRGHHVVLLHAQKDMRQAHYLEALGESGVEIVNVMSPDFLKQGIRLSREHADFFGHIPAPHTLKTGILFLAGAFARFRPHVVHSYLDAPNCAAGCAAVLAGVPAHLASFRNVDPQTLARDFAELTRRMYRYLIDRASPHFEANSRAGALHYARWLAIDPELVAYAPNGIDPALTPGRPRQEAGELRKALGLPPASPIVLTLARFSEEKSPAAMLDIFSRLLPQQPDCHYLIAGTKMTDEDEMGAMVRAAGLEGRVHLLGVQNDVAALLSAADVFLLPSRLEGFPNAIMEAMAAGLPVVASNVGGIPDLVRHGQEGFLHEAGDVDAMAASVLALLDDAALRARLGAAGRQRITEEFSLKKLGDRVLQRYETLLAEAPCKGC
ncbi:MULTISPECIES: glycosyltransferase [unclassified Desulfovibrio]|uniref:glycosyltransferase n=1 Tax=unclassified Desulfovibrio TaxID=2593640 RepID=UPI0013EB13BB|nr:MULTISPECIES: glycosyltransferase [unclassified Desulfovibrio]